MRRIDCHVHLVGDGSSGSGCWFSLQSLCHKVLARVVHGSDYPVPVGGFGPWRTGHVTRREWRTARRNGNEIERDAELKRAIGFSEETFTRIGILLRK